MPWDNYCLRPFFRYLCTLVHIPEIKVLCLPFVSMFLHKLCQTVRIVLKLGIVFLRSIYIYEHRFGLFLSTAELYSVTWLYCIIFVHSITDGPLGSFHYWRTQSSYAYMEVVPLGGDLEEEMPDHRRSTVTVLMASAKESSKVIVFFHISSKSVWEYSFLYSITQTWFFQCFNICRSDEWKWNLLVLVYIWKS